MFAGVQTAPPNAADNRSSAGESGMPSEGVPPKWFLHYGGKHE